MGETPMSEREMKEFVLGVYFRTQAAIERYMGREKLPEWTEHVAGINAAAAEQRVPDRAGRARDLLSGLNTMLAVYGSETETRTTADRVDLRVERCGIYDYREGAARRGVVLTLEKPCEFCVDLHRRTAAHLDVEVENTLADRGCHWTVRVPRDPGDAAEPAPESAAGGSAGAAR